MKKCLLLFAILHSLVALSLAQSTGFTYQGNLQFSGSPADGNFDFEFALFDAVSAGNQLGSTQTVNNVAVSDGVFTVNLNFGSQFPGASRFLEIRVRQAGQPGITTLSPRQPVSSTPYSVKSLNADTAENAVNAANATNATSATNAATAANALSLGGVAANQYVLTGDGRLTDARLPLPGSANYIQNTDTQQASSDFNISGTGTANIFTAATQFNLGKNRILAAPGTNLFAGPSAGQSNTDGLSNSFYGYAAGGFNTTGSSNSFFGYSTGRNNTNGNHNSFFGYEAGLDNTTGSRNSFFGRTAGGFNTTGDSNSFFGDSAGKNNTIGPSNSFFGFQAGFSNTTGSNNSFFGNSAGGFTTTGFNNAFFGSQAGQNNMTGVDNAFFGLGAGDNNTIGNGNTVIGRGANVTIGDLTNATAIGFRAAVSQSNSLVLGAINGVNQSTASTNVGIGTTAPTERLHVVGNGLFTGNLTVNGTLNAAIPAGSASYIQNTNTQQVSSNFNISGTGTANIFNAATQFNLGGNRILAAPGTNNLFAGSGAGLSNTDGAGNSFFGWAAGRDNTSGTQNSFFGTIAGLENTNGNHNSFFGYGAGSLNNSDSNSFFGDSAGRTNTIGTNNSFFGSNAGIFNTTGSSNSFFGDDAGRLNETGVNNAFFGSRAGDNNTFGSGNTAIGHLADVSIGILTNATAIGYRASVSQSNSLVLGSINGVNGATASTNVGIGTPVPTALLDITTNGGKIIFGSAGCVATTTVAIGLNGPFGNCINYSIRGTDNDLYLNRPVGGGVVFREGNGSTQFVINPGGTVDVRVLGTAGGSALCRNASQEIAFCSSSLRYKKNISPFAPGMSLVRQLRPIAYEWKGDSIKDVGFGAEDVARIDPRFVTYNDQGEVEGIKYDRLSVAFANAFQEQENEIRSQRTEIEDLKSEVAELKALVCTTMPNAAICSVP